MNNTSALLASIQAWVTFIQHLGHINNCWCSGAAGAASAGAGEQLLSKLQPEFSVGGVASCAVANWAAIKPNNIIPKTMANPCPYRLKLLDIRSSLASLFYIPSMLQSTALRVCQSLKANDRPDCEMMSRELLSQPLKANVFLRFLKEIFLFASACSAFVK